MPDTEEKDRAERWIMAYEHLSDEVGPWREIARVYKLQRDSGLLHDKLDGEDWRNLDFRLYTQKAAAIIVELAVNQRTCAHPDEHSEVIEHVPMGSFTAQRELCKVCGRIALDD